MTKTCGDQWRNPSGQRQQLCRVMQDKFGHPCFPFDQENYDLLSTRISALKNPLTIGHQVIMGNDLMELQTHKHLWLAVIDTHLWRTNESCCTICTRQKKSFTLHYVPKTGASDKKPNTWEKMIPVLHSCGHKCPVGHQGRLHRMVLLGCHSQLLWKLPHMSVLQHLEQAR